MKYFLILIFLFISLFAESRSVDSVYLTIIDEMSGELLPNATIISTSKAQIFLSDKDGKLQISYQFNQLPDTLIISSIGFETKKVKLFETNKILIIKLLPNKSELQEIVFSASRTPEKILKSPVSVEKLNQSTIRNMAAISLQDEIRQLKGIEVVSTGLNFKQPNSRGFNNTFSWRFLQLLDDMDNMSPALGWSLANIFTPPELDVESVELIPGAASALYGPVAFNGLLHTRTKDPFKYEGISILIKTGINHLNEIQNSPKPYTDFNLRLAKNIKNKWAYKVNLAYTQGIDFYADDSLDINFRIPLKDRGANNPARDGLNIYGDEVQKIIPGIGLISRTGYLEKSFADYNLYSLRTNASIRYKINSSQEFIVQHNFNEGSSNFTGTSRFSLKNVRFSQSKIEWKGNNFFLRSYIIGENLGDSYNTRSLAQIMNQKWVKDLNGNNVENHLANEVWFQRYEQAYKGLISNIIPENHQSARSFADQGRWLPGSTEFENAKKIISHTYEGKGAAYFSKSNYYHIEGQYTIQNVFKFFDIVSGANARLYSLYSRGTLYSDKIKNITYHEFGMYIQGSKSIFDDKVKLTSSIRLDKNPNFKLNISPRFSGVWRVAKESYIRGSYQTGFRNPSAVEQFINIQIGQLTLLGGSPSKNEEKAIYQNSFTTTSVEAFLKEYNNLLSSGSSVDNAIELAKSKLKKSDISFIQPEIQHTYELGYKGEISSNLVIDFNIDYSRYKNFSVNAFATQPNSLAFNANGTINNQGINELVTNQFQSYQLYTNSGRKVSAIFISTGFSYFFSKSIKLTSNITYSELNNRSGVGVNEIAPFNTPKWSTNSSITGSKIYRNYGFKINWHWQDAFDWYGTFNGNRPGRIKAFSILDMNIQKLISHKGVLIKIGGNNILNNKIMQSFGSPRIGGIYYISFSFDQGILNKH